MADENLALVPVLNGSTEEETTNLLQHLDELERKVEHLREQAISIETERGVLLAALQEIQDANFKVNLPEGQKEEIEANTDRLICRCLTIDVCVTTPRNDVQEKALSRVLELVNNLESELQESQEKTLPKAKSYLNACLAEPEGKSIDQKFQGIVIECTADDQKLVRKRLKALVEKHNCSMEDS